LQPASAINTEENRLAAALEYDDLAQFEALLPSLDSYNDAHKVSVAGARDDRVVINVSQLDPTAQTIDNHQLVITNGSVDINPIHIRYSWPSELDLMARLAGLRLHDRWSTWDRDPFGLGDHHHISVYGR
jgi:hypothetical protein